MLVNFTSMTNPERLVALGFDQNGEISILWSETNFQGAKLNRWFLRLISTEDEFIWGGGEQYSYFNLRQGENYPIWIREQGVGRNKSSYLTQVIISHTLTKRNIRLAF